MYMCVRKPLTNHGSIIRTLIHILLRQIEAVIGQSHTDNHTYVYVGLSYFFTTTDLTYVP